MINKAILLGNLGSDPESRFTTSGTPVTNFRLATNERFNNAKGEPQERTEWHRIVTFGKLAEICRDYLSKGRQVYIEGRIQSRSWDSADGTKHYATEIVAQHVKFLGGVKRKDSEPPEGDSGETALPPEDKPTVE